MCTLCILWKCYFGVSFNIHTFTYLSKKKKKKYSLLMITGHSVPTNAKAHQPTNEQGVGHGSIILLVSLAPHLMAQISDSLSHFLLIVAISDIFKKNIKETH